MKLRKLTDLWTPSMVCKRTDAGASLVLALFFLGVCGPHATRAQTPAPIKPGLWEMQVSVTNKMALPPEVEAKIAAMPAAQQAQMRSMMAGGMAGGMGGGQPTTTTRQTCIAPQTNMDSMLNQTQQSGMKCTISNRVLTANGGSFDMACTGATGSGSGHVQISMADEDHVSSTVHMTVTASSNGHTMNSTIDTTSTGKFVSADCGDVKPYAGPPSAPAK